jgi:hypothetical protein
VGADGFVGEGQGVQISESQYYLRNATRLALILLTCLTIVPAQIKSVPESLAKEKSVVFRFRECVGKYSVFLLENHLDRSIFARVQRVDYWKEYKKGDMELGVHFVERVPPILSSRESSIGPWDAPPRFREITSGKSVRYAIQVPDDNAGYRVRVPYMENGEVARTLDEDFAKIVEKEMPLVETSWKTVFSEAGPNRCR